MGNTQETTSRRSRPRVAFIWKRELGQRPSGWRHGPKPAQLLRTHHLIEDLSAFGWDGVEVVRPDAIADDVLLQFHTEPYVYTVRALSQGDVSLLNGEAYGVGESQMPGFAGMHEYFRGHVAAGITAARVVADGRVDRAFTLAGGFHLALPAQARCACVYNDVVLVLMELVRRGQRVAYVDFGVHHCDAVQSAFADTDQVLTISLHEGPEFLFPSSGRPDEIGVGAGTGYSVNLPLPPGTGDEHFRWVVDEVVEPLLERFDADVLVTQMGLGMHLKAPLAHLRLTTHGFESVWRRLSHHAPRWVAVTGAPSGRADVNVAPRAWALAFAVMVDCIDELPEELPHSYRVHWDGTMIRDAPLPSLNEEYDRYVWSYLRMRVNAAQRALYPYHGLPVPEALEVLPVTPMAEEVQVGEVASTKGAAGKPQFEMPESVKAALAKENGGRDGVDTT